MKADGLGKLYDRLTLAERFRLRIRALGRGDKADWERLDRTCPIEEDRAYRARLDASDMLTLCSLVELLPILAKLDILSGIHPITAHLEGAGSDAARMGYLDGYAAGWKAAGKRGDPPTVSDDDLTAAAERAYRLGTKFSRVVDQIAGELAARARTSHDALTAFAVDELGLSLDELLGAWGRSALEPLARHADALAEAEPNVEHLALSACVLDLAWRRHGLNDPTAEVDDEILAAVKAAGESST